MGFKNTGSSSSTDILPTEETSLTGKSNAPLSSQSKTFANVFIAIIGAGVLGLPYTFKKTGWIFGSTILFSVAALTTHCMMLLVYTRQKLDSVNGLSKIDSFGDIGFIICGRIGRISVDAMIVLTQAGFCVGYLIFIANTVAFLFQYSPDYKFIGLSPKSMAIWGCFPFQLGLSSIPTLTHLATLSIFADVVDVGAMGVVMVEDAAIILENNRSDILSYGGLSVFFYGVGVAVYSFEGIGMVLPLESEAKDKEKFRKVLASCMTLISLIYVVFGILGYFAFGKGTKDIITTNFGQGVVSILVQLGLCINLFFTFPLMMNPVYEVMERQFCNSSYCLWLRWLVVFVVSLVALLVPNFTDFMSLVGSSVCCVLGFVLPALFHLLVFKEEMGWKWVVSDGIIVVLGLIIGITGTWTSVNQILAPSA